MIIQATPFIMLDGNASEAIRFYEQALGARVVFRQTFGDAPEGTAEREEAAERIAHCVLEVGREQLFVSDTLPGQAAGEQGKVQICLTTDDAGETGRLYEALRTDGQVEHELGAVYFSPAYAVVTDPFGVTFQLFTRREQGQPSS